MEFQLGMRFFRVAESNPCLQPPNRFADPPPPRGVVCLSRKLEFPAANSPRGWGVGKEFFKIYRFFQDGSMIGEVESFEGPVFSVIFPDPYKCQLVIIFIGRRVRGGQNVAPKMPFRVILCPARGEEQNFCKSMIFFYLVHITVPPPSEGGDWRWGWEDFGN